MPRDARPGLVAKCDRARATVDLCEAQAEAARKVYRAALINACAGGVTLGELARRYHTSESRLRQQRTRGLAEREGLATIPPAGTV